MRFAITNGEWLAWWCNLIPEEELKRKMTDDAWCGCSVSERRKKRASMLRATKFWCWTALKTRSRRKMKPPSYYTELESSAFLGWRWRWADDGECNNFTAIFYSVLFILRRFNHFEYFKTEQMSAIVHYCGENLNKISSIFVIRVSLRKLRNFSFIELSRHALNSTTEAPEEKQTHCSSQSTNSTFYLLFFFVAAFT